MGRHKTISDEDLVAVARRVFRSQGHAASTRQIAEEAGISEAVLYQRFGSKEALFFASMAPSAPDTESILGPAEPATEARAYLEAVVLRLSEYFGEILPLALHVITHPAFEKSSLSRAQAAVAKLQEGLSVRLSSLADRGEIRSDAIQPVAELLVRMAHDWALTHAMSARRMPKRPIRLLDMLDVVCRGAKAGSEPRRRGVS